MFRSIRRFSTILTPPIPKEPTTISIKSHYIAKTIDVELTYESLFSSKAYLSPLSLSSEEVILTLDIEAQQDATQSPQEQQLHQHQQQQQHQHQPSLGYSKSEKSYLIIHGFGSVVFFNMPDKIQK